MTILRGLLVLTLTTFLAAIVCGLLQAGNSTFVIRSDTGIGGFAFGSSILQAQKEFGAPTSRVRHSTTHTIDGSTAYWCIATWKPLGLVIEFWSNDRSDPCYGSGAAGPIEASGPKWSTSRGLRVGDATPAIERLYPKATFNASRLDHSDFGWWLATRSCLDAGVRWPSLVARMSHGRVAGFILQRQSCE